MSSAIIVISLVTLVFVLHLCRARIIGYWGEKKTALLLSLLGNKYKVYNNVLIPSGGGTTQIDHIVVSAHGIFVIETKNYKGWIYGSQYSYKWTQNLYGKKYELFNPIIQNNGHIRALKRLIPGYDDKFIPIIVFSMKASVKTHIAKEHNVIRRGRLIPRIYSYRKQALSDDAVSEVCSKIEQYRIVDRRKKNKHIRHTKEQAKRAGRSIRKSICPMCGGSIVERTGIYGSFYGCSNYPKCKFTTNKLK